MRFPVIRVLRTITGFSGLLITLILILASTPAAAVPAFAVQTGQACQACHVGGFGPQLTPFGRNFKLRGYTLRATDGSLPFSAMAIASYLRTDKAQPAPPAPGFRTNDNTVTDQVSLFLAGGFGGHLGAFVQATYDGVAKAYAWDNLDLRATATTQMGGAEVVLGASLNNSPGVQDAWNTLPAWGYPYTDSALAPSPAAAPLLSGALAQTTLGVTVYAWINSELFLEAGAYGSPDSTTLSRLGADPASPGDIDGLAPYGRIALQRLIGGGTVEVGAFGLQADIHPGRDRTTGLTDRFTDLGVDASYQRSLEDGDVLSLDARYLHERQTLGATCALAGGAPPPGSCSRADLNEARLDASYYWRNKVGATVSMFDISGSANPTLFPDFRTSRPDSSGVVLQVDGTPFGDRGQPARRINLRVGVQYTAYARFDGARSNFDGAGADASDNNSLRIFAWFAF
jgi:hypothetical protein